ncbi:MAG: hypothetical protein J6V92_02820, partial [Bacteroidaceae bacterium]|nr:hypothetical protein [Bacteroidaceae bacterium]
EQNEMTKSQVAAARTKGWRPRYKYGTFGYYGYPDYEGVDDTTSISDAKHLNEEGKTINGKLFDLDGRPLSAKTARGIYIEEGKKIVIK